MLSPLPPYCSLLETRIILLWIDVRSSAISDIADLAGLTSGCLHGRMRHGGLL